MFVVVQVGSTQYKVSKGDVIDVQLTKEQEGSITLDRVLLFADGKTVKVGRPVVKGVKVEAKILRQKLGPKTIAFKYRRRKNSKWLKGHRQKLESLEITKITAKA